jgi:hypothetical protein
MKARGRRLQTKMKLAATAVVLATLGSSALAQDGGKSTCQQVGGVSPEPIGDRDGHLMSIEQLICKVESGALAGGVVTVTAVWEWTNKRPSQ